MILNTSYTLAHLILTITLLGLALLFLLLLLLLLLLFTDEDTEASGDNLSKVTIVIMKQACRPRWPDFIACVLNHHILPY